MLFNSLAFALFLPVVFLIYWFLMNRNLKRQNVFLLLCSYFFYASWNWQFLFLLFFSTGLDYWSGIKIEKSAERYRGYWLWFSIIVNLGFLFLFKYYNFFIDSFADLVHLFGKDIDVHSLNYILPVGISFYTFHGLSYVIDIYYKRIKAERQFADYALFVSFFPLLVAGPIERATHLLPQIKRQRFFSYHQSVYGLRQILWGLFKKIVIADQCAVFADIAFNNTEQQSGVNLLVGVLFFSFQIYGDFSGYSDIALGVARLFGIELLRNFSFPYFSRDISEFWRRWHISLSSWFKDYVYIPLGGSRGGMVSTIRNTFIIFLLSGFWHGANWTFVMWGFLHALYIMPLILLKSNRNYLQIVAVNTVLPSFKALLQMGLTFLLVSFAWIFFRANSLNHAFYFIRKLFSKSLVHWPHFNDMGLFKLVFILVMIFILVEWFGRRYHFALQLVDLVKIKWLRYFIYYIIVMMIFLLGGTSNQFIYFQF